MFGVKRPRDPSEPEGHDSKKHRLGQPVLPPDLDQTLRFRAPTLTPADSSDEELDADGGVALQKNLGSGRPPTLHLNPAHLNGTKLSPLANGDDLSPWLLHARTSIGSVQPSPIPQNLVHQSLTLSESTTFPTHGYFPITQSYTDPNSMEGVSFDREEYQNPEITLCLPSPISEDDASSMAGCKTPSDAEMTYNSPSTPLPFSESRDRPWTDLLVMPQSGRLSATPSPRPAGSENDNTRKRPALLVMGYRADCDKCRRRVPGHYSHINNA